MFGYTVPLYNRLSPQNLAIYRAHYCETCHHLNANFGIQSTLAVSYDMTFIALVLNSLASSQGMPFGKMRTLCPLERPRLKNDLLKDLAAYTLLLTKWNLMDDKLDKPSIKSGMASLMMGRAIEKAERMLPDADDHIGKGYEELRAMESKGCKDATMMGNAFGEWLSKPLSAYSNECSGNLFKALTTTVYIIDAIDDLEQDFMDGTYNPFLNDGETFINKKEYMRCNVYRIADTVNQAMASIQKTYREVRPSMRYGMEIADNIVFHGLPGSARESFSRTGGKGMLDMLHSRKSRLS